MNNRKHNASNPCQGLAKRVLCVCSAGLLRSPTAAVVLQNKYGYNTRAAGLDADFALIPVDDVLLEWAKEIVCMTVSQLIELKTRTTKPVICLEIDDSYDYMEPSLQDLILLKYEKARQ